MKFKPIAALTLAATLSTAFSLTATLAHAVQINEIRIDQPGSDNDEYVELKGDPNESLDGLSYIVIGDGSGGDGSLDAAIDLDGLSLNADGLLVVAEGTFTLGTADEVTNVNFENSDNVTHALIRNTSLSSNDDLDTDDDGLLDAPFASQIVDSIALVETPDSGEAFYSAVTLGPDGNFVPGHSFNCPDGWQIGSFDPADGTDTPGANNPCQGDGPVDPVDPEVSDRSIPEIQSDQAASPFDGEQVKTTGVVTADFQADDQLRGFYLQDENGDDNPATSDGVFVFTPDLTPALEVSVGDRIEIVAEVDEFFGLTELKNVSRLTKLGTGNVLPTPLTLPEANNGDLESVEGMLVEVTSPMTVSQTFFLSRFGQLTLSSPDDAGNAGRLFQPTNLFAANSPEALALRESNERRKLVLDDGSSRQNPDVVPYLGDPLNGEPITPVRGGDQVSNLVGVIDFARVDANRPATNDYILQPTQAPTFTANNPRTDTPNDTSGSLTVASFNVLNFFSAIDTGAGVCGTGNQGCRGADSDLELTQQTQKLVTAISAIDADIVGLVEIENNGYDATSAIATLTAAVNNALGSDVYEFVTPIDSQTDSTSSATLGLGTDAIAVGFIFKPTRVEVLGSPATLATGAFDQTLDNGRSRQPLAVSFRDIAKDAVFTAVINHFKSKRPGNLPDGDLNNDQGDGQGAFNLRRTEAANDLATWLETNPTGINDPDTLILGDLNAYAEEDPLLAFDSRGYIDLIQQFNGNAGYSFTFDGLAGSLDHALATVDMASQISGVTEWHINTDEPPVFDYNTEFKPDGYFFTDAFRSSDHDPVIVGLNLQPEFVDADGDLIDDREDDLCLDTATGVTVNDSGCSGQQLVDLNCESVFQNTPFRYTRCVLRQVIYAYRDGLITRPEARKIYFRAILRVFFSRYFHGN